MPHPLTRAALGWSNLAGYACPEPPARQTQISAYQKTHQLAFRMHDTAIDYGRGYAEEGLGEAWTESGSARGELRIQSKVLRKIIAPAPGAEYREAGLWRCPQPYESLITTWDWSREGVL